MNKNIILNFENRRKIYNLILNHPGLHLREISRKTGMDHKNIKYHLFHLEKQGLISSVDHKYYKRYYVKYKVSAIDKKIIWSFTPQTGFIIDFDWRPALKPNCE